MTVSAPLLMALLSFTACSSKGSEPSAQRTPEERAADEARAKAEVTSMGKLLEGLPMGCPAEGHCFLSREERRLLIEFTGMTVRGAGGLWAALVAEEPMRTKLISDPTQLGGVIDVLFIESPETAAFWEATVGTAKEAMKSEARTKGAEAFLGSPRSNGPRIPAEEVIGKAVKLDDESLVVFAADWAGRSLKFFEALLSGQSHEEARTKRGAPSDYVGRLREAARSYKRSGSR